MPATERRCCGAAHWILAAFALVVLSEPAVAADPAPITLRFADSIPKTHPISVYGSKFWMDTVSKLTGGRVQFQWYPSGQLGKGGDLLALTSSGAVDIGSTGPPAPAVMRTGTCSSLAACSTSSSTPQRAYMHSSPSPTRRMKSRRCAIRWCFPPT
jgi:Bacterial extracellular solute-binding protein, family 7